MVSPAGPGGSTSVNVWLPKKNLPRNFVALSFARVKRDCLYLVWLTGCFACVGRLVSSSCASMGVDNEVAAVPMKGVLAPFGLR